MSNFPSDLVEEVLLRLPADTLANLRTVSKSWRALIDSPEFIRSHLRESRCSGRHAKFIFHTCNTTTLFRRPSHYTTAGCPDSPDTMEATKTELQCPLHIHQFSGSCNGLICAAAYASDVVLWNPCTNQNKILPPVDISRHGNRSDASRTCYGFGHDVGRDDYKVVKLVQFYVGRRSHKPSRQEIKIYSLKSDSWRNLVEFPYFYPKLGYHGSVFANGALHWLMADVDDSLVIMGLNLTAEKYHLVPQPKDIDSDKVFNWGALDDCLCLMVYGDMSKEHAQMWTMKQYGVRDSWTKISFRLPYFSIYRGWDSMCCKPIACSGKILLFLNFGELMWYNTEEDKLDQLKVFNADSPPTLVEDGYAFTGSLVKIHGLC